MVIIVAKYETAGLYVSDLQLQTFCANRNFNFSPKLAETIQSIKVSNYFRCCSGCSETNIPVEKSISHALKIT